MNALLHEDVRILDAYILENIRFPNVVEGLIFTKNQMITYLNGGIVQ